MTSPPGWSRLVLITSAYRSEWRQIMKIAKVVLIAATTLLFTVNVNADSIRCGSHVIEDSDLHKAMSKEEVIKKCGQPSSRKGNMLYYKNKGKRLDFDTNNKLMSIHNIEENEEDDV
jgi:hypothetical protein